LKNTPSPAKISSNEGVALVAGEGVAALEAWVGGTLSAIGTRWAQLSSLFGPLAIGLVGTGEKFKKFVLKLLRNSLL